VDSPQDALDLQSIIASNSKPRPLVTRTLPGDKTTMESAQDAPDLSSVIALNSKPRPLITLSGNKTAAQDALLDLSSVIASNSKPQPLITRTLPGDKTMVE
jgi:hypothetical protein